MQLPYVNNAKFDLIWSRLLLEMRISTLVTLDLVINFNAHSLITPFVSDMSQLLSLFFDIYKQREALFIRPKGSKEMRFMSLLRSSCQDVTLTNCHTLSRCYIFLALYY